MAEPFQQDPYQPDPLRADARDRGPAAVPHPSQRNRQLLLIVGLATLALVLAFLVWQNTGTRGVKQDFASATDKVLAKEREVEEARRTLDQRIAELRVVRAEADVQAARLGNKVEQEVGGEIDEARVDVPVTPGAVTGARAVVGGAVPGRATDPYTGPAPVYYVRDNQGRFVPVTRP
jgi:hypothetical protein